MLGLHWMFLWVVAAMAVEHYPLGVNFGMKYITAAYYTASNALITAAKIEGSQDYQNHMARLVTDSQKRYILFKEVYLKDGDDLIPAPERYHGYKETDQEIIREAFRQILAAASQEAGRPMKVTSTSTPPGLDLLAWEHMAHTLVNTDEAPDMDRGGQVIEYLNAARLAHNLTTPDNLGHPEPVDPGIDDDNIAVYVDYNSHSLDFWSADVDVWQDMVGMLHYPEYEAHHPELGLSKLTLADGANQIKQAMDRYFSTLKSSAVGPYVRAVMLGGEGSPEHMGQIRRMLAEALPVDYKPLLREQIEPLYVCAYGAAERARYFVLKHAKEDHDEL